jgi:hypothetical protein
LLSNALKLHDVSICFVQAFIMAAEHDPMASGFAVFSHFESLLVGTWRDAFDIAINIDNDVGAFCPTETRAVTINLLFKMDHEVQLRAQDVQRMYLQRTRSILQPFLEALLNSLSTLFPQFQASVWTIRVSYKGIRLSAAIP